MKDNFIGNKLKEISEEYESWCRNIALDALCGKYDYIKSEDWWKEKIKQSLTDYHNHIVDSVDKLPTAEALFTKEDFGIASLDMGKFVSMKVIREENLRKLLQDINPKE